MWDCVACNLCVTVCPNDAFFRLPTPKDSGLSSRQQYIVLAELCNECGNCMVFCPENGDPAKIKAKLYLDEDRFQAAQGQGFFVSADGADLAIEARGPAARTSYRCCVIYCWIRKKVSHSGRRTSAGASTGPRSSRWYKGRGPHSRGRFVHTA